MHGNLNRKTKILYISHSPYLNGAEVCLLTLLKYIDRNLFEPIVVFPFSGALIEELECLGIKTYISPLERWIRYTFDLPVRDSDIYSRSQRIAEIIEHESVDIVHTNTSVILEGAIAAKIKNVPHVWHIHEFLKGNDELKSCIPIPLIYWIMSFFSQKIVSVSNFVKGQFKPIIEDQLIITIHNGVEKNTSSIADKNLIRENLGIKNDEIVAVTIGLVTEGKGYLDLLEAASIVRNKGYKIKFLWIGDASKKMLHDFKLKIKKLDLKNSVVYLGFRRDIPGILKSSDLLICPSLIETLSMAILEAMAAGIPVITTDCGGTSESVVEGETGYIVPVNDPSKLSEKIIEIIRDEQKRKIFGENGLKRFNENFTAKVFAERFEKLYTEILNTKTTKTFSKKDSILLDAFLHLYQDLSVLHWKTIQNQKNPFRLNNKYAQFIRRYIDV